MSSCIGNIYVFSVSVGPEDVVIWKDFLAVLDSKNVNIFTPMGIFVKRFPLDVSNPVRINTLDCGVMITGLAGDLHVYNINTDDS